MREILMRWKSQVWTNVSIGEDDECWEWTGTTNNKGYGLVRFEGRTTPAHRAAWITEHGDIEKGLQVCHRCDNRLCCNPAHLFLGTNDDNVRDMCAKGRQPYTRRRTVSPITEDIVRKIRMNPNMPRKDRCALANSLGVSEQTIRSIMKGRSWKWVK